MLTLHHAPLTGGFSHLEFDVAVKRLYITNKAEAIRLFEAGLLRYEDTFTGMARGTDEIESRVYNSADPLNRHVLMAWSTELHYYRPHILVEEEEEDA